MALLVDTSILGRLANSADLSYPIAERAVKLPGGTRSGNDAITAYQQSVKQDTEENLLLETGVVRLIDAERAAMRAVNSQEMEFESRREEAE